jgi:phosphatidylinositol alpha-1,6-mannosyltransferase
MVSQVAPRHILVTNDFPPKRGGIQSYLYELWSRLPSDSFQVVTTSYGRLAEAFDAAQSFTITRLADQLWPTPGLGRAINRAARAFEAEFVVLDPVLPLGWIGPSLDYPYVLVAHGAEISVPERLIGTPGLLRRVMRQATATVAAGHWVGQICSKLAPEVPVEVVLPGVDVNRFVPLSPEARRAARAKWQVGPDAPVVTSLSRLVPRKGMDVLVEASVQLARVVPGAEVLIAGTGRDWGRLTGLVASRRAPVRLIGGVEEADLPSFYGLGDVFALPCRNRWFGLEQEGFGMVYLEAAACGVPPVAGSSGGTREAVGGSAVGRVLADSRSASQLASVLTDLLSDEPRRAAMGRAARQRAVNSFSFDLLAAQLGQVLDRVSSRLVSS